MPDETCDLCGRPSTRLTFEAGKCSCRGSSDCHAAARSSRDLAARRLDMALMALDNASAGIGHVADDWCGHCYTKAWAERVRALT
jgi:hypothetical protein